MIDKVCENLAAAKILVEVIPPNCTSILQPLDAIVNCDIKRQLKEKFVAFVSDFVKDIAPTEQLPVLHRPLLRNHMVPWLKDIHDNLSSRRSFLVKSFRKCGIVDRRDIGPDMSCAVRFDVQDPLMRF
jgi:hypothetical protein